MNLKLSLILTLFFGLFLFSSCTNENSENKIENEPKLTEHYFFEGKIDNVPFLIEKKLYENYYDESFFSLDYGGTLILCENEPDDDIHTDCDTFYANGIIIYSSMHPDEVGKHNTGKMYFGPIDVEERVFDTELAELEDFLLETELTFKRDFFDIENQGTFAFDFFPPEEDPNDPFYYSTRFNDNAQYTANITSVEKIDNYFYIIEGNVAYCKLYDSREEKDEEQAYKELTDFKFRVKIKGDFNYNNYKDE